MRVAGVLAVRDAAGDRRCTTKFQVRCKADEQRYLPPRTPPHLVWPMWHALVRFRPPWPALVLLLTLLIQGTAEAVNVCDKLWRRTRNTNFEPRLLGEPGRVCGSRDRKHDRAVLKAALGLVGSLSL